MKIVVLSDITIQPPQIEVDEFRQLLTRMIRGGVSIQEVNSSSAPSHQAVQGPVQRVMPSVVFATGQPPTIPVSGPQLLPDASRNLPKPIRVSRPVVPFPASSPLAPHMLEITRVLPQERNGETPLPLAAARTKPYPAIPIPCFATGTPRRPSVIVFAGDTFIPPSISAKSDKNLAAARLPVQV